MVILYFLMCIGVFALGIYFNEFGDFTKKKQLIGKILIVASISFAILPLLFLAIILVLFSSVYSAFYSTMLLLLYILIIVTVSFIVWKISGKRLINILLCSSFVILFFVTSGFMRYKDYHNSIPTIVEHNIIDRYAPFNDNGKVAKLTDEPSIKITDDVPRLDGATALYPIYSSFARAIYPKPEGIENIDKMVEFDFIRCATTTGAYYNIVNGTSDIIFVGAPSESQEKYAEENDVKLIYTPIGKEAFVFFVNNENPIDNLTTEEIRDIYSGRVTTWDEFGVSGFGDIMAFQRDEGSGSQSALVRLMKGDNIIEPPKENVIEGMGGIIEKTADYRNYKNAIGYSFRFYCAEMVNNNQIKLLSVDGIAPTAENIENGTYPLTSAFYAVSRSRRSKNTENVINWILSEQGQKLIKEVGYTPIN